jgi:hypothetical protein
MDMMQVMEGVSAKGSFVNGYTNGWDQTDVAANKRCSGR